MTRSKNTMRAATSLAPAVTYSQAREKHGKSLPWRLFILAARNRAMRDHVYDRDRCMCVLCHKRAERQSHNSCLHHLDYGRVCAHPEWALKAGQRKPAPECARCRAETPGEFEACADTVRVVHTACHARIHGIDVGGRRGPARTASPAVALLDEPAAAVCPRGYLAAAKRFLSRQNIPFESFRWHEVKSGAAPISAAAAKRAMASAFGAGELCSRGACVIFSRCPQTTLTELVNQLHGQRRTQA